MQAAYRSVGFVLEYSMQPLGSTSPTVIVIIREGVTVDHTGSFTADIYAPYSVALPAAPEPI
jgi:hypothetical protein